MKPIILGRITIISSTSSSFDLNFSISSLRQICFSEISRSPVEIGRYWNIHTPIRDFRFLLRQAFRSAKRQILPRPRRGLVLRVKNRSPFVFLDVKPECFYRQCRGKWRYFAGDAISTNVFSRSLCLPVKRILLYRAAYSTGSNCRLRVHITWTGSVNEAWQLPAWFHCFRFRVCVKV